MTYIVIARGPEQCTRSCSYHFKVEIFQTFGPSTRNNDLIRGCNPLFYLLPIQLFIYLLYKKRCPFSSFSVKPVLKTRYRLCLFYFNLRQSVIDRSYYASVMVYVCPLHEVGGHLSITEDKTIQTHSKLLLEVKKARY